MFNDGTTGRGNRNEGVLHGRQAILRLERESGLLPHLERTVTASGMRQVARGPKQTEPGTVLLAAPHRGGLGGGGEHRRSRSVFGVLGKAASIFVAGAATIYQLPARVIVSMLKEAGGYVKFPWGTAVTALGSVRSKPGQFLANAFGWALLVPTLAITIVTGGVSALVNGVAHPIKTIRGLGRGFVKGVTGFFSDKKTEMDSILNGEGPSYYNLAAQYYTGDH